MPNPQLQLDSQSLVISQVRHLIRETADKEQELTARVSQQRLDAEKVRDHALSECEQSNAIKREEALQMKEKTLEKIEHRKEEEPDILKDKHEQRVIEINTQAEEIAEQSEAKLNEAIWLAESVYEGAILVPRKQAQEAQEQLLKQGHAKQRRTTWRRICRMQIGAATASVAVVRNYRTSKPHQVVRPHQRSSTSIGRSLVRRRRARR